MKQLKIKELKKMLLLVAWVVPAIYMLTQKEWICYGLYLLGSLTYMSLCECK